MVSMPLYTPQHVPERLPVSRAGKAIPMSEARLVGGTAEDREAILKVHAQYLDVNTRFDWEHLQPLSKYAMYSQNEQIHVASWPSFSRAPSRSSPCVAATVTSGCAPASGSASTLLDRRRDWRVVGALAGGM